MEHGLFDLLALTLIVALGGLAQWIAWRVRVPSILLLLLVGFLVGPVFRWVAADAHWELHTLVDPERLFGESLFPLVSIAVAIILFEGGLTLRVRDLGDARQVVRNMVTIGALVTWAIGTLAAYWLLELDWPMALLFGAILIVTGPTVVVPLLRHIRPSARISSVAKWEGIVNDPIGAVVAVLVFEAIRVGDTKQIGELIAANLALAVAAGVGLGVAGALFLVVIMRRHWVPDYLLNPVVLGVVLAVFTGSNAIVPDSGLITVTLMGIILANQKAVNIRPIVQFKENLQVLLISFLFIVLAARVPIESLEYIDFNSIGFVLVMILVARPLATWVSTIRTKLNWRERVFLAWLAPRGIVAAAVTSIFALELQRRGMEEARELTVTMFLVVVMTVAVYGLTAGPLARRLGLATPNPQGVLIAGAHHWAREIGKALKEEGFRVVCVDSNPKNVLDTKLAGVGAVFGSVLADTTSHDIDLDGIGRLLALTPNDEVNALAAMRYSEEFGRSNVFQLASSPESQRLERVPSHQRGRALFRSDATFTDITRRFSRGSTLKKTTLRDNYSWDDYLADPDKQGVPMFVIREKELQIITADKAVAPKAGHTILAAIDLPSIEQIQSAAPPSGKAKSERKRAVQLEQVRRIQDQERVEEEERAASESGRSPGARESDRASRASDSDRQRPASESGRADGASRPEPKRNDTDETTASDSGTPAADKPSNDDGK